MMKAPRKDRRRGRPSKLTEGGWNYIVDRLADGESTSALAREYGLAKSTISGHVSVQVKQIKQLAIELLRAEFSEQIMNLPVSEQSWLTAIHENLLRISIASMRHQHGRHQGRHSEP